MATRILTTKTHYGLRATFATDMPVGTIVKISGNATVAVADAKAKAIGVVTIQRDSKNIGTIDVFGVSVAEVKAAAVIAAGALVMLAAPSSGEARVTPWINTGKVSEVVGIAFNGASSGDMATIILRD